MEIHFIALLFGRSAPRLLRGSKAVGHVRLCTLPCCGAYAPSINISKMNLGEIYGN